MRKISNRKNPRTPTETETPSKKLRLFSVKEMFSDEIMTLRGYTMMLDNGRLSYCFLKDMLIQVKPKEIRAQQKCGQPSLSVTWFGWVTPDIIPKLCSVLCFGFKFFLVSFFIQLHIKLANVFL